MKVKELIAMLARLDQEATVVAFDIAKPNEITLLINPVAPGEFSISWIAPGGGGGGVYNAPTNPVIGGIAK